MIYTRRKLKAVMDDGRRDYDAGSVVSGTHGYGQRGRWNGGRQPPRAQRRVSFATFLCSVKEK